MMRALSLAARPPREKSWLWNTMGASLVPYSRAQKTYRQSDEKVLSAKRDSGALAPCCLGGGSWVLGPGPQDPMQTLKTPVNFFVLIGISASVQKPGVDLEPACARFQLTRLRWSLKRVATEVACGIGSFSDQCCFSGSALQPRLPSRTVRGQAHQL